MTFKSTVYKRRKEDVGEDMEGGIKKFINSYEGDTLITFKGGAAQFYCFSRKSPLAPAKNVLSPFSLIRNFRKQNTRGNVSKISVNHKQLLILISRFKIFSK